VQHVLKKHVEGFESALESKMDKVTVGDVLAEVQGSE
jgi:hypothetical protein